MYKRQATRISANDVGYPIDTVLMKNDSYFINEHCFEEADLRDMSELWHLMVRDTISKLDGDYLSKAFKTQEVAPINPITRTS